jgi:hypothetical protein
LESGKKLYQNLKNVYTGCLTILSEFRIQSVVVKDPVELEKFALPEEDIITLIVFNA